MGLGDVANIRRKLEDAQRNYDQHAAQIKDRQAMGQPVDEAAYQKLYELDVERKKLAKLVEDAEAKQATSDESAASKTSQRRLLRQEVGPEEIAEVVSAWTGVPVTRMMEAEKAKLLVLEERLHQRVDRPGRSGPRRRQRRPPQPLRPARPQPPHRLVHLLRPHRRRQNRALQGPRPGPLRR